MTLQATDRNIANAAAIRLARVGACPEIRPSRAGDELVLCANCSFEVHARNGSWQHSRDEIDAMRVLALG